MRASLSHPSMMALLLCVAATWLLPAPLVCGADRTPASFSPRSGLPRVLQVDREVLWNQPPDLNGYKVSSEINNDNGFESWLADDFEFSSPGVVVDVTFWGGYYYWYPGDPEVTSFNLLFYSDWSCEPGQVLAEFLGLSPETHFVGYDAYGFPTYSYKTAVHFEVQAQSVYWLVAQAGDHPMPPQWGRQQAAIEIGCPAKWRDNWYWQWWDVGEVLGVPFDASVVLEGWLEGSQRACCFDDGHCEMLPPDTCVQQGGVAQDEGSTCEPNPCLAVPVLETTWGQIRRMFE